MAKILFLTPPFTQLNTPYPATAYLTGFFKTLNIPTAQADLSLETLLHLYSRQGLEKIFAQAEKKEILSENAKRIFALKNDYCNTIDLVVAFLQGNNAQLAYQIASQKFLPQASRFAQLSKDDITFYFGNMGLQDKAKHIATLYLEDIADFVRAEIDEYFGITKYAEQLGRSANTFNALHAALQKKPSLIDEFLFEQLEQHVQLHTPQLVCITVPFPGNLFAALRIAHYLRKKYPSVKVAMGGGFANTELRSLQEPLVFDYFHFITLDDGEAPLQKLLNYVEGKIEEHELQRTYLLSNGAVKYIDNDNCGDYKGVALGTPCYEGLPLNKYLNAIDVLNPMHSLWSNGRWNKLTMAHGCYWGKCTFCDVSLPYIARYEPLSAVAIVNNMEQLIAETNCNGFHFVDEAAPPALMKNVALEIIKRKLQVSWWTNVRFEKSFTADLCVLLQQSGCIGVSGGLEVASDRLLALIKKGITLEQVALVNKHFTDAGIMVHAYLMYAFPTQQEQEIIDSLEVVRQLFAQGILQSGYWHRFAMTAHSTVGIAPQQYDVTPIASGHITFAHNDIEYKDTSGVDYEKYTQGLNLSIHNYMQGAGMDMPLQHWFKHSVLATKVAPNFVQCIIEKNSMHSHHLQNRLAVLGEQPTISFFEKKKKGKAFPMAEIIFATRQKNVTLTMAADKAMWLQGWLLKASIDNYPQLPTMQQLQADYDEAFATADFELWWYNAPMHKLRDAGVVVV